MGARSYDPGSGAFTSIDSVVGAAGSPVSLNRYLYGNGDPVDSFDPTGHWSLSGVLDAGLSWAGQQWDSFTSWAGRQADSIASTGSQVLGSVSRSLSTAGSGLSAAAQRASQVIQANAPSIRAAVASFAVGGVVFLGCAAITGGLGSVGCAMLSAEAGGAVYGAMTCPPDASTTVCAATGVEAGAAATLTGGLAGELGAGALVTGAASGGAGNAVTQLLTTGRIDPEQLATATLTGAFTSKLLSYAGKRLFGGSPTTTTASGITSDIPAAPDPASQEPGTAPPAEASPATTTDTTTTTPEPNYATDTAQNSDAASEGDAVAASARAQEIQSAH